ncbi:MAG: hypothetical protein AB8B92_09225 [Gammaproteobacteria bacterium]
MTNKNKFPKAKITKLSRRNLMHDHPLLSKGGLHQETHKSKRFLNKIKIKKEWLPQSIFSKLYFAEAILIV